MEKATFMEYVYIYIYFFNQINPEERETTYDFKGYLWMTGKHLSLETLYSSKKSEKKFSL